jgi:L-ascorbate metabolism protein UlaG (beta-lactamase superfamily)
MTRGGDAVYLREDVHAEPLVNGFRAWPHLIAPQTYAANVAAKHLPALRAACDAAQACGDAVAAGGLRRQIAALTGERPHLLALVQAIGELDRLLRREAGGFSLAPLYAKVPPALRGLVELVYDRHNNPGFRFIEGALYRSPWYDPSLQGVRLERADPDTPGAGISAPRLPGPGRLIAAAPFAGEAWDALGRARREPVRAGDLADVLGVTVAEVAPYLTAEPPGRWDGGVRPPGRRGGAWPPGDRGGAGAPGGWGAGAAGGWGAGAAGGWGGGAPRGRSEGPAQAGAVFLNHACVLLRSRDTAVLADPLVAYRRHGHTDRISFADLPPLDCLLITHAHLDHLDIETLLQIRHLTGQVIVPKTGAGDMLDPSLRLVLGALGFHRVHEVDDFARAGVTGGSVTGLPFLGEHSDLPVRGKACYGVTLAGNTCVLAADSQCLEPRVYEMAREQLGPVSALFIGMECEGSAMATANRPYLPDGAHTPAMSQSRRTRASDAAEGLALVRALRPAQVYVYAMGLEPWLSYMFGVPDPARSYSLAQARELIRRCADMGVPARLLRGSQPLDVRGALP